jgi:hypothetical protein
MSEKVIEIEKINWPLWIIVIIIVNVLANLAQGVLGTQGQFFGCIYSVGTISIPFSLPALALILPLLAYPVKFVSRSGLKTTTLVSLYVIGLVSSLVIGNFNGTYYSWPVGSVSRVWRSIPEVRNAMSKLWWVAPEAAVLPTWTAGGPVDWSAWLPAMLYVILLHYIAFLLNSSQMIILRRRWIDIEKVPYPWTIAMWEGIRNVHGFEEVKHRKTPFLVGLAIGFFMAFMILMRFLFPWFPDIIGWFTLHASPNGCVDTWCPDPLKPIGSTLVGFMRINIQPINYAIAYLIPLDILFTAWFLWVVFIVLAQIAYTMGYYTGALNISGACRVLGWAEGISPNWHAPLYWSWMCLTGGMMALVVMMLWYSRGYLREVIRAAFGASSPKIRELEAREPFSYRTAFMMLIIGCVLFAAFLASLQIGFILGVITLIFTGFIYPIVDAYAQGLTGAGYAWGRVKWATWPVHLIYSRFPGEYTPGWCQALIMMNRELDIPSGYIVAWSNCTMHGFRLADLANIQTKTIYMLMFATILIAYPISVVFRVWWPHLLGARFPNCLTGWECDEMALERYNLVPPANELAGPIIAGFIITMLLFLLRARFAWWPLHPMGFLISGGQYTTWTGVWTAFLGAWVLKWVTLRIGGSKAYQEYGVPCAAGVVLGYAIVVILGIVSGLVRWFVPF